MTLLLVKKREKRVSQSLAQIIHLLSCDANTIVSSTSTASTPGSGYGTPRWNDVQEMQKEVENLVLAAQRRADFLQPILDHRSLLILSNKKLVLNAMQKKELADGISKHFRKEEIRRGKHNDYAQWHRYEPSTTKARSLRIVPITIDDSDAAYEARHMKYETMERRCRKSESASLALGKQKLLVRIEMLRKIDWTAVPLDFRPQLEQLQALMLAECQGMLVRVEYLLSGQPSVAEFKPQVTQRWAAWQGIDEDETEEDVKDDEEGLNRSIEEALLNV